jgi:hypothetical protein
VIAQNAKNPRHGSEPDTRSEEELQRDENNIDLVAEGRRLVLVFYLL